MSTKELHRDDNEGPSRPIKLIRPINIALTLRGRQRSLLMNFTNINDPAGVTALLDRLRSSQAWQEVAATPQPLPAPSTSQEVAEEDEMNPEIAPSAIPDSGSSSGSASAVAALLSQLQSSAAWSAEPATTSAAPHTHYMPAAPAPDYENVSPAPEQWHSRVPAQDLKSYTFQQALPLLAQLGEDPDFLSAVMKMKNDQDSLERRLWEERCAIRTKYEEKVNVSKIKANMIGTGLSKHEADMINDAFKKELQRFDSERILPAWDGLVSKQQMALAALDIPTMFATQDSIVRERQQRVMQVMAGILGSGQE